MRHHHQCCGAQTTNVTFMIEFYKAKLLNDALKSKANNRKVQKKNLKSIDNKKKHYFTIIKNLGMFQST